MQKENEIRVRFAPSPTGYLHVGALRTGHFNFLYSRNQKGVFVVRCEDTDKERSKPEYEEDIMRSLKWLGIDWEEGIAEGKEKGKYGPYKQSERSEIYKKNILKLLEEKKAYYCFCDKEKLEAMRTEQRKRKEPPRYEGKCFNLSEEERKRLLKEKKDFTIRLKIPENEVVEFDDKIRGKVQFNSKDIGGDFVIARNDLSPLYNFACAVDDVEMKISHVIRGEDHISNTPKQILIQKALGFKTPKFAHLPLLLGNDKSKLSKRHGATSLTEYREKGYLPEAIINFVALLGWHPGGTEEIYSVEEIIKKFSLKACQKSGAVFDITKLDYINGHYIRKKDLGELTKMCIPYLVNAGLIQPEFVEDQYPPAYGGVQPKINYLISERKEKVSFQKLREIISLYQERMKILSEVGDLTDYFFKSNLEYEKELLFWQDQTEKKTTDVLERLIGIVSSIKKWDKEEIERVLLQEANKESNRGNVLWPLRVALSGKKASASPFDILLVLGPELSIKRLKTAKNRLKS